MDLTATPPRFEQIYRKLIVADIKRQLSPLFPIEPIEDDDIAFALSVASRLALVPDVASPDAAAVARKAYDVAVRTLPFGNGASRAFREASELILSRLGNFPARKLLLDKYVTEPTAESALEILGREFENRARPLSKSLVLTDFQVRLLRALDLRRCVSVSAPTSAGKSFALELEISRQLARPTGYQAVYIVPTRALIRQVTYDLVALVRGTDLQGLPILSVPSPPDNLDGNKIIYVLTQERLANLLANAGDKLALDAIIVDEAQEIAESDRGQTLEAVIAEAIGRFPSAKVFFSTPLKSNPEYLPALFGAQGRFESFVEHLTPVSQNIINVYPIKGRNSTARARFEVWLDGESVSIGTADLPFRFRKTYVHKFALMLTAPEGSSIIYCNEPSTADKLATALAEELPAEASGHPALRDLSDFLRGHIHSRYRLADVLERGVAFHYGNIPQIIRARIEELLRDRVLRFVCCTSTLLQGMNLPAKNIFVENPRKGRGRPMSSGDFWNLVGRAGRMAQEFEGNIYCIHGAKWASDPLSGTKLGQIRSAFATALTDRVTDVAEIAAKPPDSSESSSKWAEQAIARAYSEFTKRGKRLADSEYANPANRQALQALDEITTQIARAQTLPDSIMQQNLYFHPSRLEQLAVRFREDPAQWIPPNPHAPNSYAQTEKCFRLLEEEFLRTGFLFYRYHAFLALRWMQGASLRELITNKIDRNNAEGDTDRVNDLIRDLFDDVENTLRYKYVKYMKVYADVLRSVFLEKGLHEEAERIPPIHLYLEYGASTLTLINLIAIGLSRTSAILLQHARGMRGDLSPAACQKFIEDIDIAGRDLPAICRAEVARLRRRA